MAESQMDPNSIVLLTIAALNAFTAIMAWRTHQLTKTVELATNSMKDALVAASRIAGRTEGFEKGFAEGEENLRLYIEDKRIASNAKSV